MRIAIISDVHGNLPALEAVLKDIGHVDQIICLGDVVNYGPWSNECVDLLSEIDNCFLLQGNHERCFLQGRYDGKNQIASTFFDFCIGKFDRFRKIANLSEKFLMEHYTLQHTIEGRNIYPDSKVHLDRDYVIGHSHHQFRILKSPFCLYNAGSVGQNRKIISRANYLIYRKKEDIMELKGIPYDVNLLISRMKADRYPEMCLKYYLEKVIV
ncbi:MAG: metallophosphoesterase [bacterium]